MDISTLTLDELRQLQNDITKQLKNREQAELSVAREKIFAIAKSVGISVTDLIGTTTRSKTATVAVQFQNPDNSTQQWTGRGRQPLWVKAWLTEGKSIDLLKV
jgi:DNA-binding protein H-NS